MEKINSDQKKIYLVIYPDGEEKKFTFPNDVKLYATDRGVSLIGRDPNNTFYDSMTFAVIGTNCSIIHIGYTPTKEKPCDDNATDGWVHIKPTDEEKRCQP